MTLLSSYVSPSPNQGPVRLARAEKYQRSAGPGSGFSSSDDRGAGARDGLRATGRRTSTRGASSATPSRSPTRSPSATPGHSRRLTLPRCCMTSGNSAFPIDCSTSPGRSRRPNTTTSNSTRSSAPTFCRPLSFPGRSLSSCGTTTRTGTAPDIRTGCAATAIPIGARVLAIVDCYDALTSDRPYRRALSHGCAVAMIRERRGTMYDPEIVERVSEDRSARREYRSERTSEAADPGDIVVGGADGMKRRKSDNPTFLALPAPARAYVVAVVVAGAACLVAAALPAASGACRPVRHAAGARRRHLGGEDRAAARPQPVEPVAVARRQLLGAVRARTRGGRVHRDRERLGAVHACAPPAGTRCTASCSTSDR